MVSREQRGAQAVDATFNSAKNVPLLWTGEGREAKDAAVVCARD